MTEPVISELPEGSVVLLALGHMYQLYQGEEFLDDILMTGKNYPVPIICIRFTSGIEQSLFFSRQGERGSLWKLNPGIYERLQNDGHVVEMSYQPEGR